MDKLEIGFTSKIVPVKPINDQLTLCRCYVLALGQNQNKTNISKEAVDDALPSLYNIPVVGHLIVDEDSEYRMGGHDLALERSESGGYQLKKLTVPYGTVPQQDNVHYETVTEKDGTENVYQVADIILWTGRYPELLNAKYSDDIYFAQSMEIIPIETSKGDGYTDITKFQYSALCLLGKSDDKSKNVEPCFESAKVEPYFSATSEWTKLFEEFKGELAKSYGRHNFEEGGEKALNTEAIKRILLEFGLAEDTELSFEVTEDMTEEQFRAKLSESYAASNTSGEETPVADNADAPADTADTTTETSVEPKLFAADWTYREKHDALCKVVGALSAWTETEYVDYCLLDFDEKYAYCAYYHAGDNITTEDYTVRIPYTASEDGAIALEITAAEYVRQVWLTKADEDKLNQEKAEFQALTEYKHMREEDDRRKEYAAVLANFSDLGEVDEYKAVMQDVMSFESAGAFEEKLYAIRGKNMKQTSKKPLSEVRIPIGFEAKKKGQSEIDEFMNKYLKKN